MLTDKQFLNVKNQVDPDTLAALDGASPEALKDRIAQAQGSIKSAQDELAKNEAYVKAKEDIKALSSGLKDVKKRQNAIVEYSLHLLEEKGKV